MQCFWLSRDNLPSIEHFLSNRTWNDAKTPAKPVCCDAPVHLVPIVLDGKVPTVFEYMDQATHKTILNEPPEFA